ncbi:MAG: hypothetical protein P1U32_03080 [Legionellaceae bacterium]|nr:hypothetical protein [Legionellaceae bacterium]
MPTFYDPVELEDVDINDERAKFYLVASKQTGKSDKFKLCATIQELDKLKYDPETRAPEYWPITREQIKQADQAALFPDNKMRSEPFTLEELNSIFHFDSSFNPDNIEKTKFQLKNPQNITQQPEPGPFARIITGFSRQLFHLISHEPPAPSQRTRQLFDDMAQLHQQATNQNSEHNLQTEDVPHTVEDTTVPVPDDLSDQALEIFKDDILKFMAAEEHILNKPTVIEAIRNGIISVQDFKALDEIQISNIGEFALGRQGCIDAIVDGRTTIEQLAELDAEALRHAVETDDYPQSGMQLR